MKDIKDMEIKTELERINKNIEKIIRKINSQDPVKQNPVKKDKIF